MNELLEEVEKELEWLETTLGEEVECISIENLRAILENYTINRKNE